MSEILETLKELFKKEEKETLEIPPEWRENMSPEELREAQEARAERIRQEEAENRPSRLAEFRNAMQNFDYEPLNVPISMKVRRIVAFLLMIMFLMATWGTITTGYLAGLIINLPTAYILFDYLAKTRKNANWKKDWFILDDIEEIDLEEEK